jgi:hypothetical protein
VLPVNTQECVAEAGSSPARALAILHASIPLLLTLGARACADVALEERAAGMGEAFSRIAGQQLEGSLDRVRRRKAGGRMGR